VRVVTKAVDMVWYTLTNRHVVTVRYVLPVYLQGLEFHASNAKDTLGVRHDLITSKIKRGGNRKSTCEPRKCSGTFGAMITQNTHECNKRFFGTCKENKEDGLLCFMRPLVNVPDASEHVLYVFYDFETTEGTKPSVRTNEQVPNLVCLQQFCSKCENVWEIEQDCIQCVQRIHSFWEDPVGDMLIYFCEYRP